MIKNTNIFIQIGEALGTTGKIIGAIIGAITLGGIVFTWGMKAEGKRTVQVSDKEAIERVEKKVDDLVKSDQVKTAQYNEIVKYITTHAESEEIQEKRFSTLEGSYTGFLKAVNRLDLCVQYFEDQKKQQQSEDEKKK
jgi:hypothetical protein